MIHKRWSILLVLALAATASQAQAPAALDAAFSVSLGRYLIDGEGRTLYAFLPDERGASTCTGDCAAAWPPVVTDGEPTVGSSLDPALLGTVARDDGSTQVTYGGWPLYTYASDEGTGSTTGQGVGDAWYLVGTDGNPIGVEETTGAANGSGDAEGDAGPEGDDPENAAADPDEAVDAPEEDAAEDPASDGRADADASGADVSGFADLMAVGEAVFHDVASPSCASCHGAEGGGGAGPGFVGNSRIQTPSRVVGLIVNGGHIMPAFGGQLSDRQIAGVLTYIRNSWGNDYGPVTEGEVSELR